MGLIKFNNADRAFRMKGKKRLKEFVLKIVQLEGKELYKIEYVFCSDDYLLKINQDFLKHDNYTDIITFDLSEARGIEGEVYISLDRVVDNAKAFNTTITKETLRVVFHGALHLCGYRDKKKSEITTMRQKEDYYLSLFDKDLNEID